MSYLVLARKWRPRDFEGLVGQEHVVRALTHALTTQRLHHAWLFTGTRGVGKTTLSRILAKSLNCETGITAKPCGECMACRQIDEGRFVDYVELDAASNRGVDEMTQLLEQAVYAPTAARFKVYMIDEVHMLSGHAFNAMLKTLEEPPAHVKFILATTDPQKIPATVLSRCLQFNLKSMAPDAIAQYLAMVLTTEGVAFEEPALRLIGQAAAGSMRDALSLTDQAISYSSANLDVTAVRGMLGTVDQTYLVQLVEALWACDAPRVVQVVQGIVDQGLSLGEALSDLGVLLSRLALMQRVGVCDLEDPALEPKMAELASQMSTDLVQLFYTVAVHSRQELALAPDEHAGFLMVCLRMLGFVESVGGQTAEQKKSLSEIAVPAVSTQSAPAQVASPDAASAHVESERVQSEPVQSEPVQSEQAQTTEKDKVGETDDQTGGVNHSDAVSHVAAHPEEPTEEPATLAATENAPQVDLVQEGLLEEPPKREPEQIVGKEAGKELEKKAEQKAEQKIDGSPLSAALQDLCQNWPQRATELPVEGMARELAMQSICTDATNQCVTIQVQARALAKGSHVRRLKLALQALLDTPVKLAVNVGDFEPGMFSAQQQAEQALAQRLEQARQHLQADPFVQALIDDFDAQIVPGSVQV